MTGAPQRTANEVSACHMDIVHLWVSSTWRRSTIGAAAVALPDEPIFVDLSLLELDPENPRLPAKLRGSNQNSLIDYIVDHYNAITIAESIARFGYFPSEPLVALKVEGSDHFRVIEGNRRLAALKGLADPEVRGRFRGQARWNRAARRAGDRLPKTFPVLVAESWDDAAPLIGFRHISGITEWEPFQKASFIARLVDGEDRPFDEIAELVGEKESSVRTLYRNFSIVEQARDLFELPVAASAEELFGTFTAVLNRRALREFIGGPQPAQVKAGKYPLPTDMKSEVADLLSWIYGDDEDEPVIDETRDLGDLARIVESPEGLDELRASRDLDAADTAAGGPGERLRQRLEEAATSLAAAARSIKVAGEDSDVDRLIERCGELIDELRAERSVGSRGGS
jgi:hypothetical protein